MAQTLGTIQTAAAYYARDTGLDLTTANSQGLAISNQVYRDVAALLSPSELNRTDTSLTTTADTEEYTWPSSPIFIDVTSIEVQDPTNELKFARIDPVVSNDDWTDYRNGKSCFPRVYKRAHNGSNNVIQLAPKPKTAGLTIRITGIVEPTAFSGTSSTTVFLSNIVDDAISILIAASFSSKRAQPQRSAELVNLASRKLSAVAGREIQPSEIQAMMIGNA